MSSPIPFYCIPCTFNKSLALPTENSNQKSYWPVHPNTLIQFPVFDSEHVSGSSLQNTHTYETKKNPIKL